MQPRRSVRLQSAESATMVFRLTLVAALVAFARAGNLVQSPALAYSAPLVGAPQAVSSSYQLRATPAFTRYAQIAQPVAATYHSTPIAQPIATTYHAAAPISQPIATTYHAAAPIAQPIAATYHAATPIAQPLFQSPSISAYSYGIPAIRAAPIAPVLRAAPLASAPLAAAPVASAPIFRTATIAQAPIFRAAAPLAPAPLIKAAPLSVAPASLQVAAPIAKTAVLTEEYDANPQYEFGYDVHDSLTGDIKSQVESRSGDVVQGSYSLNEADGTRRIVDYQADPINGFNAVVRKEPLALEAKAVVAAPAIAKIAAPLPSATFIH